jgi:hypothetical protein
MMIKLKRKRWVRHVARMKEMRSEYRNLDGMTDEKRSLGRPKHR